MLRILMNNCGSQAVEIINLLHEDASIYVVYLSVSYNSFIGDVSDEFYIESPECATLSIEDYKDFLIDFCKENSIDLFIPFKRMEELSYYVADFTKNNIKIMLPSNVGLFRILNNKVLTYDMLKETELIPLYKVYNDNTKFGIFEYLNELRSLDKIPCIKYVTDIASNSFRIVRSSYRTLDELDVKSNKIKSELMNSITDNDLYYMISHSSLPKDMMVMEYLEGCEVSCDCLSTKQGNIIIPRIKKSKDVQLINRDEKIITVCNSILDIIDYDTPCNIQFKMHNDSLKLLEINTRMSGGIMYASRATGINLPLLAVKQCLGESVSYNKDWKSKRMIKKIEYIDE